MLCHFNPPAPCGAGPGIDRRSVPISTFQSTRPLRGGTITNSTFRSFVRRFQSTRPLRGGTAPPLGRPVEYVISIHPPLAGRDSFIRRDGYIKLISIHPPLAGRDRNKTLILLSFCISIHPPLAGRDIRSRPFWVFAAHFNPPAPCGAGHRCPHTRRRH